MMYIVLVLVASSALADDQSALQEFISSNHKFASSIYKEIVSAKEENFVVSPLSAQLILALSQSGARNDTEKELRIGLSLPKQKVTKQGVAALLPLLENSDYNLRTINKIYIKENCSMKADFEAIARNVFRADLEQIDFSERKQAAEKINHWVEEETNFKIRNLLNDEIINNETVTIFVNALQFSANWTKPFQFFDTHPSRFYTSSENFTETPTMHIWNEEFEFYEKFDSVFLILPLEGNASMTVVLPNEKTEIEIIENRIREIFEKPETSRELFNVALPKFIIESKINFKEVLMNLGVRKAFEDGEADFSPIAGEKGELFISDIIQKNFIDVNEDGIEAAAATFIVKLVNRNGNTAREFIADRPFIFFIKIHNLVVFLGKIVAPSY